MFLAYCRLCAFLSDSGLRPVLSFWLLDKVVSMYLGHMFEEGEPKSWSTDVAAAVQFFLPASRHRLGLSWSLVQTWHRHEIRARALPFTVEMLGGFAGALLLAGHPAPAAGAVVAFSLILRNSELLQLTHDDVVLDSCRVEGNPTS